MSNNHKQFFAALSNEGRLEIVNALSEGPLNVSQIISSTGFKQSRVSRNLDCLACCGFVSAEKKGRERIYKLNETVLDVLKAISRHERFTKSKCKCGVEKKMATDAICKMNVSEKSALKAEHNGQTYYFCSAHCQQAFKVNPEKYVR